MEAFFTIVNGIICLAVLVAVPASIFDLASRWYRTVTDKAVSPWGDIFSAWKTYAIYVFFGLGILVVFSTFFSTEIHQLLYMSPGGFVLCGVFLSYVWLRQKRETWSSTRNQKEA